MGGRRLVFLNRTTDAPAADASTDYAILDSAWTPGEGAPRDLLPIRDALWSAIRERNLHDETLAALDDWADRAGLVDRFRLDGVSWWYHVRGFIRLDLYEMLLWRIVLDELAPPGRYERVEVPADRPNLLAALQAPPVAGAVATTEAEAGAEAADDRPAITVRAPRTAARRFGGGKPSKGWRRRPWYRRAISRSARLARRTLNIRARLRRRAIHARLQRLVQSHRDVLAIVRSESFHVVRGPDGEERFDPIVTPVLRRLAEEGYKAAIVVIGPLEDQAPGEELREEGPLPYGSLASLLLEPTDGSEARAELASRVAGLESVPLPVQGVDLAPAVARILAGLDGWIVRQVRERLVADRLLAALRPRVLLTGWEAARTSWLAAAGARAVRTVAIQHGVIYRNNPDYYRPIRPGLLRPDLTCTFGEFERRLLVADCGYPAAAVVATGSPRMSVASPSLLSKSARARIRRTLGVADGDRLLVISGARHAVGEELQSTPILAGLLDGPLPGAHIVVKLHPEEENGDHYLELIEGLAAAGGWPAPPVTVVRDIDLFDLLRASDAHLGIYSTVLTDAVVAGTPNMVSVRQAWSDLLGYVAAGVAHPVASVDDVREFLANPIRPSTQARTAFLLEHYAAPDGAGQIAAAIAPLLKRTVRAA